MRQHPRFLFRGLLASMAIVASFSAKADEAKKIEGNSFLTEEAYNQEAEMVQYIQSFQ